MNKYDRNTKLAWKYLRGKQKLQNYNGNGNKLQKNLKNTYI